MRRYEGYIGQVVGGSYRLDALIKVGGMGAVYRASHTRLPRAFAVKILHLDPAANPEIAERFQREAEITSTLSHPHIVQVLDFNVTDDGVPFLVMELLQGRDLSQCLRDEPPRPLSFVLELLRQAADALHTAHDRGVIHRDLKPSNLFLCETTRGGLLVKVLDFGISKLLGAQGQMTHTHAALGTPRYMAPEQASGRAGNVDARTDIFALGTIVYEMLAGVSPFQADSIPGTLYRVVHEEPEPLELLRPDLPAELVGAVKRAMSKNADERFGSMGELAHAVLDAAQQVAGDLDTLVPPSWDGVSGPPTPSKHRLRGLHQRSYEIAQQRTAITPVQPSLPRRRRPPSSAPLLAATATETDISHDLADEAPTRVASNPFASNPVLPAALESAPPAPMPAPLPASAPPLPVQSAPMQLDPNGIHSRTTGVKSQPAPAALEAPPMMAPTVAEPLPMVADMRADLRAPQATDVIDEPPRSRLLLVFIITTLIATSVAVTVVLLLSKPKKQAGGSGTSGAAISAGSASGAGSAGSASGSGGGTVAGSASAGSAATSADGSAGGSAASAGAAADASSGSAAAGSATGSGSAATAAGSASAAGERKLWVMTRPSGARVFLGQRMLGRTPLRGMMIPVGNAVLVVRHAGYRSRRVDVDAAATPLQLDLKLTRKRPAAARGATLRIMTTHGGRPMWASVEVDGRGRGESPVVLKLASGTHRVRVSRAGYRAVARTVSLAPGAASRLVIELRK